MASALILGKPAQAEHEPPGGLVRSAARHSVIKRLKNGLQSQTIALQIGRTLKEQSLGLTICESRSLTCNRVVDWWDKAKQHSSCSTCVFTDMHKKHLKLQHSLLCWHAPKRMMGTVRQ